MTEENRKEIIDIIQKGLSDKKSLQRKYAKLQELMKDPSVIKFMELRRDIERIEQDLNRYKVNHQKTKGSCTSYFSTIEDTLENRINLGFRDNVHRFSCDHNVWIYDGSRIKRRESRLEPYPDSWKSYGQYDAGDTIGSDCYLVGNYYVCLECRAQIEISAYEVKAFEDSHTVLNCYEDKNAAQRYQNLYYNLLYNDLGFEEAQKRVIDECNKDKKKRLCKPNN